MKQVKVETVVKTLVKRMVELEVKAVHLVKVLTQVLVVLENKLVPMVKVVEMEQQCEEHQDLPYQLTIQELFRVVHLLQT